MNETGYIRRIDDLGRVVIPKSVRHAFDIREGDPIQIFITKDGILLTRYEDKEIERDG